MLEQELDRYINDQHHELVGMKEQIDGLRQEIDRRLSALGDSLRLYESVTGSPHPLVDDGVPGIAWDSRSRPRLDSVLAVLDRAPGPITVEEIVASMPDAPERGAVTAALHRAVKRGDVRRLRRGVYERATRPKAVPAM